MESMFVWIVMFAGVAIALLGAVLVASERELKTKRREVEVLFGKLESVSAGNALAQSNAPQDNSAQLAELRGVNQDLHSQIAGLSGKLELSRRTIEELEATQQSNAGDQQEVQQLRAANDQLRVELTDLRNRLRASEAQLQGAAALHQDSNQPELAQARVEIAELRRRLDDSQAKIHGLKTAQQNVVNVDALEAKHREERQSWDARAGELEREISSGREKLGELDTLRARCVASEQAQQSLREEIRRHEEEIPRWQARIAEAETNRQQLSALQKPYSELLSKHVAVAEKQRELQEDLAAFAQLISAPAQAAQTINSFTNGMPSQSAATESTARIDEGEQAVGVAQPEPKRARRFGIFPVVIVLTAAAAFGAWYVSSNSSESVIPAVTASTQPQDARLAEPTKEQPTTNGPLPTVVERRPAPPASAEKETANLDLKKNTESLRSPATEKPPTRLAGTYQITRASRVYAAPNEFSQSIGDIEPGVKVSVVNSRDGWLEIHSRHGRPPGFIRTEVAARVAAQN